MALTSRKRRPLDRTREHLRDTRLVIIATEGRETERQYFAMFRSTRVQVQVLATGDDNRSAPEHVLTRLRQFRDDYQLGEDDALWLMIDVDRWGQEKLALIAREAPAGGFGLAVSHPCFEVWLLLHFTDRIPVTDRCNEMESNLRQALGGSYNKAKLDPSAFAPHVSAAVERAQAADSSPTDRWPNTPGSHVYKLIRTLPEDLRTR
jgi:hypothetical protein